MLEALCLADVVIVENNERFFFQYLVIIFPNKSIVEELRLPAGCMGESAYWTQYLKVRPKLVFSNDDELSARALQALKTLENDVAHSLDV